MKLIVGLGNPGSQYIATRHNIGFRAVEKLARNLRAMEQGKRWHGVVARAAFAAEKVFILKPHTYMNDSGRAVAAAVRELSPDNVDILIVLDDLALPLGTLRFRPQGSDGGQKGMQSIIQALGHNNIPRLRLGIGADSPLTPRDFVLESFLPEETTLVDTLIEHSAQAMELWIRRGIVTAMNQYNGPVDPEQ
jgi:PTH1 family peptidyl-tRNA hydrolase